MAYDDYTDDEGIFDNYPPRRRRPPVLPDVGIGFDPRMTPAGNPGAIGPPPINRQSRYGEIQEAKDAYLQKTPGRGKSAILAAIKGALSGMASGQGALGGAVTGAIGGAIDPRGMREQEFNRKIRPQIEERFGYEDQAAAQQRQQGIDAERAALNQAQIGNLQSEGAYRQGQLDIGRQNAQRQSEVAQSTIDLNNARAEAARTGKSVIRDVVGDDGTVKTYQIGANGEMTELGGSAKAAISAAGNRSREGIAARREAGASSRAAARGPKQPAKYVSRSQILQYAEENKVSPSDAAAAFKNKGYRITR